MPVSWALVPVRFMAINDSRTDADKALLMPGTVGLLVVC